MNIIDASKLLVKLREHYTYEEIATKLGKSFNTVYCMKKGERKVSISDYDYLTRLLEAKSNPKVGEILANTADIPPTEES